MSEERRSYLGKTDTVSIPRWAWGGITAFLGTMLLGGMAWCTSVSSRLDELRIKSIDREGVTQMIETTGPYVRDKAALDAWRQTADKMLDRHDADARRISDTLARVEAKLDLIVKKDQ